MTSCQGECVRAPMEITRTQVPKSDEGSAHKYTYFNSLSLSYGFLSALIDYRTRISTKRLAAPKMRNRCVVVFLSVVCM